MRDVGGGHGIEGHGDARARAGGGEREFRVGHPERPARHHLERGAAPCEAPWNGLTVGLGFAYVGEHEVADALRRKRLVRVLEPWCTTWGPLALYYPGHRQVPAGLRAFIEVARRALR